MIFGREYTAAALSHPATRQGLAEHLAELCALAGWQALDRGQLGGAWHYHERGKTAAGESDNPEFAAHTAAEQAFVLIDLADLREPGTRQRSPQEARQPGRCQVGTRTR